MASSNGNKEIQLDLSKLDVDFKLDDLRQDRDVYIFFSFDLVGSTKFKTEESTKSLWPHIIFRFYELIYNELKDKIPQIIVWKYLGDEVLLYVSIRDFESDSVIYTIPDIAFSVQLKVAKDIKDLFNKNNLDIKSTIWIAGTQFVKPKEFNPAKISMEENNYKNLKMILNAGNSLQVDFLGPDMDIGFRVAEFAYHHKVVLSADFAYLLYRMKKPKRQKGIDEQMKIVSFEILKGVWNNQYYPIIWYYPNWKCVENDFFYAEYKENEIIDKILSNRIESINKLEKVYEEIGKLETIDGFIEECIKINSTSEKDTLVILDNK